MSYGIRRVRAEFPALSRKINGKRLVYMDNACSALKPRAVIEAVDAYMTELGGCGGGRSGHFISSETEALCFAARRKTAEFIGAQSPSEIIFTGNTTAAVNLVASAFPFTPDKNEVLVTPFDHHSGMLPFVEQEKRGRVKPKIEGFAENWRFDEDRFLACIGPRTALVSFPLASNVTGQPFAAGKIISRAHKYGAAVLCDAAQYVAGHSPDVSSSGADMLAFSGHKIGSLPVGALYCSSGLMAELGMYNTGGGTVSDVHVRGGRVSPEYFGDYRRFEAGIQNYPGIISLGAAIDFINAVGRKESWNRVTGLAALCRKELEKIPEVLPVGPPDCGSAIVSFLFRDRNICAQDFNIFLNSGLPRSVICVRCGNHCAVPVHRLNGVSETVRVSFFVYNTEEDVSCFVSALKKFLRR